MKKNRVYISICSRGFTNNLLNILKCIYKNSLNNNIKISVLIVFNQSKIIKKFQKLLIKII
jgi:hypothetical protein